jgi:hypothetical protein
MTPLHTMSTLPVATVIAAVFLAVLSCGCIFIAVTVYPCCHYFHCHLAMSCKCHCQCLWNLLFVYIWKRHEKVKVFWCCISDIPFGTDKLLNFFLQCIGLEQDLQLGQKIPALIKNKEQRRFSISKICIRIQWKAGHRDTNIRLQEELFISKSTIK